MSPTIQGVEHLLPPGMSPGLAGLAGWGLLPSQPCAPRWDRTYFPTGAPASYVV